MGCLVANWSHIGYLSLSSVASSPFPPDPQFIVGERVVLKSMGGSTLVTGVVESISPMRTCILTDKKHAVFINNKDVSPGQPAAAGHMQRPPRLVGARPRARACASPLPTT